MKYKNPVIRGFNPDPSVCRVGDDYYLVTSSFEYFPGIPIYHSRDLVNWELIGHCIDRKEQLPLSRAHDSGGIWAPTIRYYNGKFYVTATFSGEGNFIVSSAEPGGGYSDPVWVEMGGIDPSMMFEDGKMYYCANNCGDPDCEEGISAAEVDPETGKIIGRIHLLWTGTGGGWLEGPHIYHIGEYYYIIAAEGGTSQAHTEVAARSRELFGKYEPCPYNPILTNRNDTTKQAMCCGHADLVIDKSGVSRMVHLGTRPAIGTKSFLGRETFLTPLVWENDWFYVPGKKAQIIGETDAEQTDRKPFVADFSSDKWEKDWMFVREMSDNFDRGNGRLAIRPSAGSDTRGFAAVRQPDFKSRIYAEFDFDPVEDGDGAGIMLYLSGEFRYKFCKKRLGDRSYIIVERYADDMYSVDYLGEVPENRVRLVVRTDKERCAFLMMGSNSENEAYVRSLSTRFLCSETADRCFTGAVVGIYAECDKQTSAEAVFYRFEVE